jgi:hypothetical protein
MAVFGSHEPRVEAISLQDTLVATPLDRSVKLYVQPLGPTQELCGVPEHGYP